LHSQTSQPEHFQDLASLYLYYGCQRLSPGTYQRRRADFQKHLLPFFGNTPLYEITAMRIRKFACALKAQGISAKQCQQLVASLRACLKYAARMSWLNVLPWPRHKVDESMALTSQMPILSATEFKGLYADLLGDMQHGGEGLGAH
jgi:site-specific recombinase XerD